MFLDIHNEHIVFFEVGYHEIPWDIMLINHRVILCQLNQRSPAKDLDFFVERNA